MDHFQRLVGEVLQLEQIDLEAMVFEESLARMLREARGLRDLAGAGMLAARRTVYEEDARGRRGVLLLFLGFSYRDQPISLAAEARVVRSRPAAILRPGFILWTRFLRRTGSPPRIKSGAGFRRKTLCFIRDGSRRR
jgi:hypothetical protein